MLLFAEFGMVREFQGFAVPLQPLLREAIRQRAHQHGLGQGAAVTEVCAGFAALDDRVDPIVIVILLRDVGRVLVGRKI